MKQAVKFLFFGVALYMVAASAIAGPEQTLIDLDKQWGTASMAGDTAAVGALLADDLVSVSEDGIVGKAEDLAANEPAPEGATYDATDYKVMFLDDNTAIMTHAVGGENGHYSLHVWSKDGDSWKVVATSSTPAKSE